MKTDEKFEKLNKANYLQWSIRMRGLLELKDCLDAIGFNTNVLTDEQRKKDEKCKSLLYLGVDKDNLDIIEECTTATEIWNKLKEIHTKFHSYHAILLLKEFVHLEMDQSENILDYVNQRNDLYKKVQDAGFKFESKVLMGLMLIGLSMEYEYLRKTVKIDDDSLTLDSLEIRLIEEEKRLKDTDTIEYTKDPLSMEMDTYYLNESPCQSQVKTEFVEREFESEEFHHSIDIKEDPLLLEVIGTDEECKSEISGQQFTQNKQLEIPVQSHTAAKKFTCKICGRNFAKKRSLKMHKCADTENFNKQISSFTDTAEEVTSEAAAMDIQQTAQAIQSNFVMDESDNNDYIQQESTTIETLETTNSTDLVKKVDNILKNQELIIKNQNTLLTSNIQNLFSANIENQTKIFQKLAKLETMVDLIGDKIISGDLGRNSQEQTIQRTQSLGEMEPIQNLTELEELEQNLCNKSTMEEYIGKFCIISGTKGNGSGINSAYLLIDRMFTRKFMTLCSWAGGARDKKEKIAFKSFKNVIELFFRVIQLADRNFTLTDCEEFIKNVIRNSTRRSESSNNTRVSTTKRRPKKITYKLKEGNRSESIENGEEVVVEVIQN